MINFDGWVMVTQYDEGVLLQTGIALIVPEEDGGPCEGEHDGEVPANYTLTSPEEYILLCQDHVEELHGKREQRGFVMGALPAN